MITCESIRWRPNSNLYLKNLGSVWTHRPRVQQTKTSKAATKMSNPTLCHLNEVKR